jgi:hypothetical protein
MGAEKELKTETTFHYYWEVKSSLNEIYLPMQLTDWLLVKVSLLLIGPTEIALKKSSFNHPSVIESPLRLLPPV